MCNDEVIKPDQEDSGEVVADNSCDSEEINELTGEFIERPKFRSMWCNPYGCIEQDLSNEIEDVFEEIEPFAIDAKTGKFLNNSSVPKIVYTGKVNVHDRIQSFKDDVDIYKILEKFAYSGDQSIINAREVGYGDISDMPTDLNGFAQLVNNQFDKLNKVNPELAKMVIDDKYTADDIEAKANEIMKARIDEYNNSKSNDNGGNE